MKIEVDFTNLLDYNLEKWLENVKDSFSKRMIRKFISLTKKDNINKSNKTKYKEYAKRLYNCNKKNGKKYRCHLPFCHRCRYIDNHYIILPKVLCFKDKMKNPYFLTLTTGNFEDFSKGLTHVKNSSKRFHLEYILKNNNILGAIRFLEIPYDSSKYAFNPHMHLILELKNPPNSIEEYTKEISDIWHKITGNSMIVNLEEIYDDKLIRYLLDYIKSIYKQLHNIEKISINKFEKVILSLKHLRFINYFGIFHKGNKNHIVYSDEEFNNKKKEIENELQKRLKN